MSITRRQFSRSPLLKIFILFLTTVFALNATGITAFALESSALPTGGQITAGEGAIGQSGHQMTVSQQTDRMIAQWENFNIGQDASVAFLQPGASSVALNRILDASPSQIWGHLTSNGQVFLLNAAGIIFGPSAQIDVGGLVASSLNISDEDFMAGNYALENNGSAGAVENLGNIRTTDGGYVAFLSPHVVNEGEIVAPNGDVILIAADKVNLDFTGDKLINFTVEKGAIDALVENNGIVRVSDGLAVLTAKAADELTQSVVNNSGLIEAKGMTSKGGRIILDAGENGTTTISGILDASSLVEQGGRIVTTGKYVLISEGAQLLAKGMTGGGEILVGGGWQGSDPSIYEATGAAILKGALLDASATDNGNGGTVVAWSDIGNANSVTRVYGRLLAKGGANSGDGGRIETSGHWLDVGVAPNVFAPFGFGGTWLIDPYNITVAAGGANTNINAGSPFESTGNDASLGVNLVDTALGSGNVTIQSGAGGAQAGDITWNVNYTYAGAAARNLTLSAHRDVVLNKFIKTSNGALTLQLSADSDSNSSGGVIVKDDLTTGGGGITFGGIGTIFSGSAAQSINTSGGAGGAIIFSGEVLLSNTLGITLTTGGGNVSFSGIVNSGNSYVYQAVAKTWSTAMTDWTSGAGTATGSTYLATITSALENSAALAALGAVAGGAWLGGADNATEGTWQWKVGPENGTTFWVSGSQAQGATGYNGYSSRFVNWNGGEPNDSGGNEDALQLGFGSAGQWNDLPTSSNTIGSIVETNLALSPLTVNAGAGNVTFSGSVGGNKALKYLTVTAATTAIDGGAVTTGASSDGGTQSYSGDITLGSAATVLTMIDTADNFVLQDNETITKTFAGDAGLTIKTTANIYMNAGSSITASSNKLSTTLWSDSDANGGMIWMKPGATIASNGSNVVLAGGADDGSNGGTASDGIPDGFAKGNNDQADTASGVWFQQATINTAGGNVTVRGKGATSQTGGVSSTGIELASGIVACTGAGCASSDALNINSGTGKINLNGVSQEGTGINAQGVQLISGKLTSANTASDAITIVGDASATNNTGWAMGADLRGTIQTTAGGGISITGTGGTTTGAASTQSNGVTMFNTGLVLSNSGPITITGTKGSAVNSSAAIYQPGYVGKKAATDVTSSSSNITLVGDTMTLHANDLIASTGTLTVKPNTPATTIGVAGGAGTLALPVNYFSTNFTNGFSSITVGDMASGLITVGNDALSYNDPLTLKTDASIFFSTSSALTGNGNALVLWTRSNGNNTADDANEGSIWLPVGSSIATGGGNVTIGGGADPTAGYAMGDNDAVSDENNARYRGVTVNGTINAGGGNIVINGRGNNASASRGVSIGGTVQTSGAGAITIAAIANGASDGLAVGDTALAGGAANIGTVEAVNGNVTLTGTKDTGSNGINISTTGSVVKTTGSGEVALTASSGNIAGTGCVISGGITTLIGAAASNMTLTNTSNDFTGAVTVVSGNDVSIYDANAMTLGSVSVNGVLDIATLTNDLTLTGAISTADATASAIKLNAGKDTVAGTSTGGNIIVSGGSVTTGAGGRATLFSGSVSGSTGLTALIGSASGNFRYNSDETATNYTTALGTGKYAIYREQPTVTTTAADDSKTYNGVAYSGGNGVSYSGFVNGDTSAILGGALVYGGTAQGATDGGTYTIVPSGYTNGLGYTLAYSNGALTIGKVALSVTAIDDAKTYSGIAYSGGNGVTYSGFVNGETAAVLGGVLAYGGTSQGAINEGNYVITPSGLTSNKYTIGFADGVLMISENSNIDTVTTSLTSLQEAVNGTQQDMSGGTKTGSTILAIGPGGGSLTLDEFVEFNLVVNRVYGDNTAGNLPGFSDDLDNVRVRQ